MKKADRRNRRRTRTSSGLTAIKWIVGVAIVAAIVYGLSRASGVPYDEDDIRVVDFSALDGTEKRNALQAANRARCTCGCGLGLAQCVATDATCPIREPNIERIRTMVREANVS